MALQRVNLCGFRAVRSIVILAVAIVATQVSARVYLRRRGGAGLVEPDRLGWREAFRGVMDVDGVPTDTQVFASGSSCQSIFSKLDTVFKADGAKFVHFSDVEMGWGLAVWKKRQTCVFVLAPRVMNTALIFMFHSPLRSRRTAKSEPPEDVRDYPGTRLSKTVIRRESGLNLRFLRTYASSGEVLAFYEENLMVSGWHPLIADRAGRSVGDSLRMYGKEGRLCCISVKSSGNGGENVITVLTKTRKRRN